MCFRGVRNLRPSAHAETVGEVPGEFVFGQPVLAHAVAVAYGDRPIGERVVIDHDARRRTDLVLTAVKLPDVALVVLRAEERPQAALDALRALDQFGLVARERKDADLDRSVPGDDRRLRPAISDELVKRR